MPKKVTGNYYGNQITNFAKQFNKTAYGIGSIKSLDVNKELHVDEKVYAAYKENYIKRANSPEKFFWEIVADAIDDESQNMAMVKT